MLNSSNRLDGRPDCGGSLRVDQDRIDQSVFSAGEPAADRVITSLCRLELAICQFQPLAQALQHADKLRIPHDRSLIGVHFTSPVSSAKSPMVGAAVNLRAQKLDFAIGVG